jgi:hypothetical protein
MSKVGKGVGLVAAVLVVGIAVAGYVVLGRLGRIIEDQVETTGPQLTGTDVDLGSAMVSIFSGEGALRNLSIGNPKGFSGDDAFDLGKIAVAIDVRSLAGDIVRVKSVVIDGPKLLAEFDATGRNNLKTILDHVKAAAGGGKATSGGKSGADPRIVIEEFRFENAEVHALAKAFDLDKTVKLPPVVLRNVGGRGGATAAQLGQQVLRPIIDAAVQAAMKEYLAAQRAKLGDKVEEKLMDKLFDR